MSTEKQDTTAAASAATADGEKKSPAAKDDKGTDAADDEKKTVDATKEDDANGKTTTEDAGNKDGSKDNNNSNDNKKERNNNNNNNRRNNNNNGKDRREDRKPVEELFDLTKPIPRVDKPNKDEHEKQVQELSDAIRELQDKRREIQERIDNGLEDPATKAELQEKRAELNALKRKKGAAIDEKKGLRSRLDSIKNENERIIKDKKDARSNTKFQTLEEINKEIARLERLQETTSMSLNQEKKLIKEIDLLQASKKYVTDIKSKDAAMDDNRVQRKSLGEQLSAKDKEIDGISKEIEQVMEVIKGINDKESTKRGTLQDLFAQRDTLRQQISEKLADKDAMRDEFRLALDAWYDYQRAVKAQRRMQQEEERAKRDAERAEYEAQLAAEEAKKVPYEEEQALCEFLATFLERTYLGKTTTASTEEGGSSAFKKDVAVPVEAANDPFAGFTPVHKKKNDDDDEFFSKGKGKKKRQRNTKKQQQQQETGAPQHAGPFTLSVDTFEQFGMIQLNPPTKLEQVEASVAELRAKKEWYKQQPRGSVPTAQEIRKQNEKKLDRRSRNENNNNSDNAASQSQQQQSQRQQHQQQPNKKNGKKGGGAKFSLDENDFVPLGASTTTSAPAVNSSWGQKPATAPVASADDKAATTNGQEDAKPATATETTTTTTEQDAGAL